MLEENAKTALDFLAGGGSTGVLVRSFDWQQTPLGRAETWPQSLRTAVSLMLGAVQPVYIAWGSELTSLYNDAYLPIVGTKHPGIGLPFRELWAEVWDEFRPIVEKTLAGDAQHFVDMPIALAGRPASPIGYFTFTYTPLRDEAGRIAGIFCAAIETTEQVLTEQRLGESEARFRNLADHAPVMMWVTDADGFCTYLNRGWYAFTGQSETEAEGFGRLNATHPADKVDAERIFREANAARAPFRLEYRLRRSDGSYRWAIDTAQPRLSPTGEFLGYVGSVMDIDDRREAESEIAATEARLRLVIQNAEIGFWDVDIVNDVLIWSARTRAMFGIPEGIPTTMQDFYDGLHPEDREATSIAYAAAADPVARPIYDVEYRTVGKEDGVVRWVAAKGRGVFDDTGRCLRVAGTAIDITARKTTERALVESEARLRAVVDAVPVGLVFADAQGTITGGNARVDELLGKPLVKSEGVEVYSDDYIAFHADGRRVESEEYPLAVLVDGGADRAELEVQAQLPDGSLKWVRYIGTTVNDESGMIGAVIASLDIDREKRLSENLAREVAAAVASIEERTTERDRLWQNSQDVLIVIDNAGILRSVNPSFTRVLGWSDAEAIGRSVFDFIHPDDQAESSGALERASLTDLPYFENRYRDSGGGWQWLSWVASPEGDLIYASARHVTAEKEAAAALAQAQEALRQSQKMEAMGSLTGGVAHDFNNLLTPIFGSLDMLQRRGVGDAREQRLIAGALQSAERAKTLVQRLLAFARRQPLQPVPVDVSNLARGMADLVASTTGPQIKVVVEAADGLSPANADPNQLEMAILNLSVNARDAMPNGGTLRISVLDEIVGPVHGTGLPPGRYIRLSVADTGEGMDETTLKHAVEPFFSTKGVGQGTGLGLSMAHGLASQLGGVLTISSTRGVGTNVELWLPESTLASTPESVKGEARAPSGKGTVLLVDDEELVRLSTADMLAEFGYTVVEAGSAEDALRLVGTGLDVDLLVTDHLMPGMTGTELARTLLGSRPSLTVLIVSGYAEAEGIAPDLPRLSKPFRQAELASALNAVLAQP